MVLPHFYESEIKLFKGNFGGTLRLKKVSESKKQDFIKFDLIFAIYLLLNLISYPIIWFVYTNCPLDDSSLPQQARETLEIPLTSQQFLV